ncbi:MAG: MBL fold metallo-hydrolase [Planctomycetaceae bacterium]|nr:MBL fold metallo-hydrolase [Planctomycetaceae bacterium]
MAAEIHTIRLRLSNAFLVLGDKPVLVDAGSPGEAGRILDFAARHGVEPHDIALIVATHGHADHVGAAAELHRLTRAPIAAHVGDKAMIAAGRMSNLHPVRPRHRMLLPLVDKPFEPFEINTPLSEGMSLGPWGVSARVIETPGHSAGSVTLVLDNGDAIAGDVLIGGFLGGLLQPTRPRLPYFAEDLPQLYDSIDRVLAEATRTLYVGHGGPLDHPGVLKWRLPYRPLVRAAAGQPG